ncbi:anthranilate synthase/aminodeoxychorismate synthase-like glutamine amidotransferase [Desulfohalotomaculum tongense]|uniref:glutamine amidotransferase-related protein n=1 Tax=Desulforadius tongensis TaxID=1216062 RepID=UPI00195B07D4|nr:anthranilate synthase/aminodeoxychorismate synthase-like glutamine amidotransferase [Desulforadius tongensis]
MLIIIDNYDSFVYNIYQYAAEFIKTVKIFRNDCITCAEIELLNPSHIIISPGPGRPGEAGISIEVIKRFAGKIPVLGVCLGHQSIGQAFGGRVVRSGNVMHGKESNILHDGKTIYTGLPNPFTAGRYHSLCIQRETLPEELIVSAWTKEDEIMGVRHRVFTVEGVQFHPESILTPEGKRLVGNFLKIKGGLWNEQNTVGN